MTYRPHGGTLSTRVTSRWKSRVNSQSKSTVWEQFELKRPTCFLLHHDRTRPNLSAADKVADLHLHEVAPTKFAIDREIEQCAVTQATALIEVKSDLPYLLWFQGALRVDRPSGISMIILRWPEWPSAERLVPEEQECPEAPADQQASFAVGF